MMKNKKKELVTGIILLLAFAAWTILIQTVDVQAVGVNGTTIGLATINTWFHKVTGVHMSLYVITIFSRMFGKGLMSHFLRCINGV